MPFKTHLLLNLTYIFNYLNCIGASSLSLYHLKHILLISFFSRTRAVLTARYGLYFCACAVQMNISPQVSRWPVTAGARVRSQALPCEVWYVVSKVAPTQFLPRSNSVFPWESSSHQWSTLTLIFIHMLLLPEGQTGEVWKPSKKQCSFVNLRALARDSFFFFAMFTMLGDNICIYLEAENTLRFMREIAENIMNDMEYKRNFVIVGKGLHKWRKLKKDECTNVRMGDEYWFANFVNSLVLWKSSRSFHWNV